MADLTQKCQRCRTVKPLEDFSKQKRRPLGVRTTCKPCELELKDAWRTRDREARAEKKARLATLAQPLAAAVQAPPAALADVGAVPALGAPRSMQTLLDEVAQPYLAELFETAIHLALGKPPKLRKGQEKPSTTMLTFVLERLLGKLPDRQPTSNAALFDFAAGLVAVAASGAAAASDGDAPELGAADLYLESGGLPAEPGATDVPPWLEPQWGPDGPQVSGGGPASGEVL